jgi:hypothetical protein
MAHPSSSTVAGAAKPASVATPAPTAALGDFVINLCASTTPMALARPSAPELARFTFFVSRRREEGRERFRLHMGYFGTREEAEQMLLLVRDVYPAAWVGEAPGKRLQPPPGQPAQTANVVAAPAVPAAPSAPAPAAAAAAAPAPAPAPAMVATPAPAPVPAAVAAPAPAPAIAATAAPRPVAAPVAARPAPAPAPAPVSATAPAPASRPAAAVLPPKPAMATAVAATRTATPVAPPRATAPARPVTPPPATPGAARPPAQAAAAAPLPAVVSLHPGSDMSDSQVLRVLEGPAARTAAPQGASSAPRDIALLSPEDTQTWREIKTQLKNEAAVHFAVQLEWSVSPIEVARLPDLAIFNAYTLYKIEGNREGRKWFGLRLGFFSDALSAKQVAYYVRSEFAKVAVVPVSSKEREQAHQIGAIERPRPRPLESAATNGADDGSHITLIEEPKQMPPPVAAPPAPASALALARAEASARAAGNPPAAARTAIEAAGSTQGNLAQPAGKGRRPSRPRGNGPQTLEETLEILGASQLAIDNGNGERLSLDERGRRPDAQPSTFLKLLDRLTDRLRR